MQSPIAAVRHAHTQAEPDIQLAALWQAVRGNFKLLLIATSVVAATAFGAMSLMAARYTSESQIEFVARRSNPFPEAGERANAPDNSSRLDQAAINTHARALVSSDLLLKVADELKLRNRAEFNSALGSVDTWSAVLRLAGIGAPPAGDREEERVLAAVRRQVEVAAVKETRSIAIRFTSVDNALAARFANHLADTYRAGLVLTPVEETSKVVDALIPKVEQLRKEVLDAEGAVERYRASSDQYRSGPQSALVSEQRMAGLQDELLKSEAVRNEADARWRTANELLKNGSAEVLPDVQKSALIQGLIQQRVRLERQLAETSAALLPGHPRMKQMNADVAGLTRQIRAEVHKVVQSIEKDARSAAIRVESVSREIAAQKSKVSGQTGNEARLKELESFAKSKRTELDRLQKQLEDNRTVVNIRQVPIEAQVISRALVSSVATFPRTGPATLLAAAATLILGLAFVVTRALVTPASMNAYPAPSARRADRAPATAVRSVPKAAHAAGFDPVLAALAVRLATRTDTSAGVRTLVTTESAGLDPIPVALVLVDELSRTGKRVVLLVWDLAGNSIAVARTSLRKPGITDLLQGTAGFDDVIGRMPGRTVHLIQPGTPPANPGAVLDPDRLNLTLDALDEAYDQIVVAAGEDDARLLFEAVEGRFDAALVVNPGVAPRGLGEDAGVLLGFEVTGIDVVHIAQSQDAAPQRGAMPQRSTSGANAVPVA